MMHTTLEDVNVADENGVRIESADSEKVENIFDDIENNESEIDSFGNNTLVEGRWSKHDKIAADYTNVKEFQNGAKEPDSNSNLHGLSNNHGLHGGRYVNCIAIYRYLNKVARAVNGLNKNATLKQIKEKISGVARVTGMEDSCIIPMLNVVYNSYKDLGIYGTTKKRLTDYVAQKLKGKTGREKEAFMFGMASHTATDLYAHASYRYLNGYWYWIDHIVDENGDMVAGDPFHADNKKCVERRWNSAIAVLNNIILRYNNKRSEIDIIRDFLIDSIKTDPDKRDYYNSRSIKYTGVKDKDATYRLFNFQNYMRAAGEKDSSILGVYGWATVYSDEKKINTIKD